MSHERLYGRRKDPRQKPIGRTRRRVKAEKTEQTAYCRECGEPVQDDVRSIGVCWACMHSLSV